MKTSVAKKVEQDKIKSKELAQKMMTQAAPPSTGSRLDMLKSKATP